MPARDTPMTFSGGKNIALYPQPHLSGCKLPTLSDGGAAHELNLGLTKYEHNTLPTRPSLPRLVPTFLKLVFDPALIARYGREGPS